MHRYAVILLFNPEEDSEERRRRNREFYELKLYKRALREHRNPFTLPPEYFRKLYRLYPAMAQDLAFLLEPHILAQGGLEIHPHMQVLCALRFFAGGPFQQGAAQDYLHPSSQPTFCRILNRVVNALCNIAGDWIKFPSTRLEREEASQRFLLRNPIRGIIGLIDCFVVKLIRPSVHEEAFFNFKHGHSFNVQVVCGENFIIYNLRICPGSNNDRHIWRYSEAKHFMRSLRQDNNIVANEGNAERGTPNAHHTTDHCSTRCIVERVFADLTNKYISISRRRVLYYKPVKAAKIIVSAAVLHNYQKYNGQRPAAIPNVQGNILPIDDVADYQRGLMERQRLINMYYKQAIRLQRWKKNLV